MTVSYTGDVANGSSFGCFWKILHRWRGSVYKLIWRELLAYLFLYFVINATYRLYMTEEQRRLFEKVKVYCSKQIESIPMSFVLGFYVSLIVKRWWDQYWILPLPDNLALYISASVNGQDERGRILRRTIMRYAMLSYIICLQRISFRVKKRFPSLQHLVDTGLMMESEKKIFDIMDEKTKVFKFWMPVIWASNLVNRARVEGRIVSDHMVQTILMELSNFRRKLGRVMVFDTVSVPLVYTQVVTLAVYTYFVAALMGRQWVFPTSDDGSADSYRRSQIYPGYELDLYFPIFLTLQFIFYIGWLKVAETLINPFGEDDDDFELNWLIDRHVKVSYMVVDEMHEEHPELLKDQYWEQVVPQDLPYNIASERFRRHEPQGSTASLKIKASDGVYADLTAVKRHSVIPDEVYADYEIVTESPVSDARKTWIQRQWSRVGSLRSMSSSSSRHRPNGPLPLTVPHHDRGHRPSLYERILSRRSSKDHSGRRIRKDTNAALMLHPNSRPRVPTPDVAKEAPLSSRPVEPHANLQENSLLKSPSCVVDNNLLGSSAPSPINKPPPSPVAGREMLPPPYEGSQSPASSPLVAHSGSILSPIAENDGSPYSTSSTSRSSPNYPSTTSIFGRKPSPPPFDELPPVPVQNSADDRQSVELHIKESSLDGCLNEGFEPEQDDNSKHYMTIAEVNQSQAEYLKNGKQPELPPPRGMKKLPEMEDDDGYDEKGSYNEDEDLIAATVEKKVDKMSDSGSDKSASTVSAQSADNDSLFLLKPSEEPAKATSSVSKDCEVFV